MNSLIIKLLVKLLIILIHIESENKYILGVGPNNAHKKDEFITIESLNKLEEQYIEILKEKCE